MLMRTVPGIDDTGVNDPRQEMRRAGSAVADHDEIRVERFQVSRRVLQRLAFLKGRSFRGEVDDVRREALLRQFKANAGPRRGFNEQIDDGFAPQSRHFLYRALADGFESARRIQ